VESKPSRALHTPADQNLGKEAVRPSSVTQVQRPFNIQPSGFLAVHQCCRGRKCVNPKGRRPQEQSMWWHKPAPSKCVSALQVAEVGKPISYECK